MMHHPDMRACVWRNQSLLLMLQGSCRGGGCDVLSHWRMSAMVRHPERVSASRFWGKSSFRVHSLMWSSTPPLLVWLHCGVDGATVYLARNGWVSIHIYVPGNYLHLGYIGDTVCSMWDPCVFFTFDPIPRYKILRVWTNPYTHGCVNQTPSKQYPCLCMYYSDNIRVLRQ